MSKTLELATLHQGLIDSSSFDLPQRCRCLIICSYSRAEAESTVLEYQAHFLLLVYINLLRYRLTEIGLPASLLRLLPILNESRQHFRYHQTCCAIMRRSLLDPSQTKQAYPAIASLTQVRSADRPYAHFDGRDR